MRLTFACYHVLDASYDFQSHKESYNSTLRLRRYTSDTSEDSYEPLARACRMGIDTGMRDLARRATARIRCPQEHPGGGSAAARLDGEPATPAWDAWQSADDDPGERAHGDEQHARRCRRQAAGREVRSHHRH